MDLSPGMVTSPCNFCARVNFINVLLTVYLSLINGVTVFTKQFHCFLISVFLVEFYAEHGFFEFPIVDNTDVYYVFHEQKIYNALLDIFNAFTEKGIKVIVNGGDVFISEVINNCSIPTCINAVNQETVFTSINFDDKSFGENNWENREYFIEYLNVCKQNGMDVLLIEYGANDKLREKVMDYCNENDYVCYFADSLALD